MFARLRPHVPALLLACVLSAVWALRDWAALTALRLPDTDDVMRLQQVRDWIAGQPFADLAQHRLADGIAMHWSRIGDLVPAEIILALRPFAGQHAAEVFAVIAWPVAQFAVAIAVVGSIAERLSPGARGTAIVLAGLAYPATTLFLPGRIDHHGLQLILVLVQLRALLAPPDWRSGAVAGVAVAMGAAIGLETLPFALVTGAVVAAVGGPRQAGFGYALAAALALLLPIAGHGGVCDTIAPLAPAAILGALAMAATAHLGMWRLPALALATLVVAAAFQSVVTPCLSGPYGAVDPLVARLWLAHVAEAQPLLAAPLAHALGYAGLMLVGLTLLAAIAWHRRGPWLILLALHLTSLAITLAQLRGVYVGAALAAVPIGVLLAEARAAGRIARVLALWIAGAGLLYPIAATALSARGADAGEDPPSCTAPQALTALATLPPGRLMAPIDLGAYAVGAALAAVPIGVLLAEARAAGRIARVLALWIAGAGLLYPIAATALSARGADAGEDPPSCTAPQALTALATLPPGRLMAPIDLGAYAIGATSLSVIAAPYHRNDAGNAAMYRFFLGRPDQAARIAARWRVDIVALCPGAFAETGAVDARSIAGGARPAWLMPVSAPGAVPQLFTVQRRLPPHRSKR